MNKICLFLCIFFFWHLGTPHGTRAEDVYKLSMLPRYYPKKIKAMINPLADYLSGQIGAKVTPVLTSNFKDYEDRLNREEIGIGYENPLVYTKVSGTHEALLMAVKGEGGDRFRGIIITHSDSTIHTPGDLKHKKIMIVGKTSAGGFLSQKLSLAQIGISVETDCELEVASDNKQENVIISVSIGDADAGFIRESALHIADKYIQPGSVAVMGPGAWLPNWVISVKKTIPETIKLNIKSALLSLEEDSSVLEAMKITKFKPAQDSDYDIIRSLF